MFSKRSHFATEVNAYTTALEAERARGATLLDLSISNPTRCGFDFSMYAFSQILSDPTLFDYAPIPHGLFSARKAIANYYLTQHSVTISPESFTLTSGTSEAYRLLFELLCDAEDEILVPSPGYPLIDFLAKTNGIEVVHYALCYEKNEMLHADRNTEVLPLPRNPTPKSARWRIDLADLGQKISSRTRAIVLISPGNPTGHIACEVEIKSILEICAQHQIALIVDEVFIDYAQSYRHHPVLLAQATAALTFVLNGLSKSAGLPQMKLSWILAAGPTEQVAEARRRIEFLADNLLSVSTFAQLATPSVLKSADAFRAQVNARITQNRRILVSRLPAPDFEVLAQDGAWCQVVRVPERLAGEEGAIACLREAGVIVLPAYFFDFEDEHFIVISLIVPEKEFCEGIARIAELAF